MESKYIIQISNIISNSKEFEININIKKKISNIFFINEKSKKRNIYI